jgi:hypothetical protein
MRVSGLDRAILAAGKMVKSARFRSDAGGTPALLGRGRALETWALTA